MFLGLSCSPFFLWYENKRYQKLIIFINNIFFRHCEVSFFVRRILRNNFDKGRKNALVEQTFTKMDGLYRLSILDICMDEKNDKCIRNKNWLWIVLGKIGKECKTFIGKGFKPLPKHQHQMLHETVSVSKFGCTMCRK